MTAHELYIKCSATIGLIAMGKLAPLAAFQGVHIPPIVIESFQIGSYCSAMVVALITVHKFFKGK